ncbi:MAG TPA: urea ABC transporter substrate-binding protein [Pseudomonadales bacterium]|jgi:urea transport system substrate-binding protein
MQVPFPHHSVRLRFALLATLLATGCGGDTDAPSFDGDVRVGILHSRTGTLALSENTVAEAELLAIREINEMGGIQVGNARLRIVPVEEDGQSDPSVFATRLSRMIDQDGVKVVFGGWTSASRKAMVPVLEARDHLLFYPIQYEGEECSANVLYAGATPNQQAGPAIAWLLENRGRRFVLAGSDYVYPRTANAIIRRQIAALGGEITGEFYIDLGEMSLEPLVRNIEASLPSGGVIVNTINGDSNVAFFESLQRAGITGDAGYSVMSFSLAEEEIAAMGAQAMVETLAAWSFFQSLETPGSIEFTRRFRDAYGAHRVTSDPAATGYSMVHLWAAAVEKAGSVEPEAVRDALPGVTIASPLGELAVLSNHHVRKATLIGEVQPDGQFKILHAEEPIIPTAWSPWLPENEGFVCDFSQERPDASRFRSGESGDDP